MHFKLIFKQAIRDFKSKLQLFIAFTLFLIVTLSIIIGLLTFFNTYSGIYNNVFTKYGFSNNAAPTTIKFVSQKATKEDNQIFSYDNSNYLQDNGEFEDFVFEDLSRDDRWAGAFDKDALKNLKDHEDKEKIDKYSLINYIGISWGHIDFQKIKSYFYDTELSSTDMFKNDKTDQYKWLVPNNKNLVSSLDFKNDKDTEDKFNKAVIAADSDKDKAHLLTYLALIKLNRDMNPTFADMAKVKDWHYYDDNLLTKFYFEKVLPKHKDEFEYGTAIEWEGNVTDLKPGLSLEASLMPGEEWMDDNATDGLITPEQYQKSNTEDYYIEKSMKVNKIDKDFLQNRLYAYVTPSFFASNHYKLGQVIPVKVGSLVEKSGMFDSIKNNSKLYKNVNGTNYVNVEIIGTAISRKSYFRSVRSGIIFMPAQTLNLLEPMDELAGMNYAIANKEYSTSTWLGSFAIYDKQAKMDTDKARKNFNRVILENFWPRKSDGSPDAFMTIDGRDYNPGYSVYANQKLASVNVSLFRILCFVISAAVALLTIVVFWFVAVETVKLQKNTLWFLKALGEGNGGLSLLTTLSVMVPFLVAAVGSIFGSLFVSWIMNSAVSFNYAFHIPGWTFNLFSFITFIVIVAVSFLIFVGINYINLSAGALNLHSNSKVGFITWMYMKTKRLYAKLPTGGRIGISFIIQNLFKNILTLILLLISFAVVLFAMQFSSSARASAHSFEKRNAPYKSLMMNKLNTNDAISFDKNYIGDNFGVNFSDKKAASDWNKASAIFSGFASKGYQSNVVESINDSEDKIAAQAKLYEISSNYDFNGQMIMSTTMPVLTLYSPMIYNPLNFERWSMMNRYLTSSYMTELMDAKTSVNEIADEVFRTSYDTSKDYNPTNKDTNKPTWWEQFRSAIVNADKKAIGPDGLPSGNGYADKASEELDWTGDKKIDLVKLAVEQARNKNIVNQIFEVLKAINEANGTYIPDEDIDYARDVVNSQIASKKEDQEIAIVNGVLDSIKKNFADTLTSLRAAYNSANGQLGDSERMNIAVYFNRTIIPKDTQSVFSTDMRIDGDSVTGFGLDPNDSKSYSRLVKPYKEIPIKSVSSMKSDLAKYTYKSNSGKKDSINVHYIDSYISGKLASSYSLKKGDVVAIKAAKTPYADMSLPTIYFKVDKIIDDSSLFNEVYFNKLDYLNYIVQSKLNDWDKDVTKQKDANDEDDAANTKKPEIYKLASKDGKTITDKVANIDDGNIKSDLTIEINNTVIKKEEISSADITSGKLNITFTKDLLRPNDKVKVIYTNPNNNNKVTASFTYKKATSDSDLDKYKETADAVWLAGMENHILQIKNGNIYELNNAVYSKTNIPYSLSHLTMGSKFGAGYSLFDYVYTPGINYSSKQYNADYSSEFYIFRLVTEQLMNTVQPIITTLNRFVALLLIVTFVVAVILIELVLLHNRQTILLFKAMGYKKHEVNGYLLSGYIVSDILGLIAGLLIAHFAIRYASAYTVATFQISLYAVWSWQLIVTAALMGIIFILMILAAVTWYTNKQRPRDAFATL